jgi:NhaP-type Na+/H+ or K+/H+ antiporter
METIWEVLQWVGNTLIFMLAGIIVGTYIVYYSVASDYALIILVYLYIFLTRYIMLGVCYPLLSRMSPGYSYYDVCFSSFAGLRGAVSLVLCIVLQKRVDSDYGEYVELGGVQYPKSHIRHLVFIISGVVTLTILVNGTLARAFYLYLYTKVDEKSTEADKVILHYVRKRIWRRTEEGEIGKGELSLSVSLSLCSVLSMH